MIQCLVGSWLPGTVTLGHTKHGKEVSVLGNAIPESLGRCCVETETRRLGFFLAHGEIDVHPGLQAFSSRILHTKGSPSQQALRTPVMCNEGRCSDL